MDSSNFNELVLERKRERVIRTVHLACDFCHLSIPAINFGGCPLEGANGPELAHYHPDGSKICISEKQLKKQSLEGLEETTIHEVIHHLGLEHGSASEKSEFERIKNYVRTRVWKPPQGIHFISGETVNEESERIRKDPKRFARANEDSDLLKFLEGKPTSYMINKPDSQKPEEIQNSNTRLKTGKTKKPSKSNRRNVEKRDKKIDIEEKKLKEKPKEAIVNTLTDEELNKIMNKTYENQETGFGGFVREFDKYGMEITTYPNKTNDYHKVKKKKSFFDKVKDALGID